MIFCHVTAGNGANFRTHTHMETNGNGQKWTEMDRNGRTNEQTDVEVEIVI